MVNQTIRLPDGQVFTVVPVFSGLFFKSKDLNTHHNPFPVGWTIVLHTQDDDAQEDDSASSTAAGAAYTPPGHSFRKPTLQGDSIFISSISNPSSSEFKPATSPTRQIAFMLYVSLYWYFHQPEPLALLQPTADSSRTPEPGRPRGEWRIHVQRDGVLRGRNLIPKLERMGLIATLESSVGVGPAGVADAPGTKDDAGWDHMYVSRSMFWQTPAQLFLFTLQPIAKSASSGLSSFPGSPTASRPGSPAAGGEHMHASGWSIETAGALLSPGVGVGGSSSSGGGSGRTSPEMHSAGQVHVSSFPIGPFFSTSHLPTYYPPGSLRYTMTGTIRHPARPKPPRMGEVFYSRFVPSANQYLSLRVASLAPGPVPYLGPVGPLPASTATAMLTTLPDMALLQKWMASPRVQRFWGAYHPEFLSTALARRHSFPVIALWDGVPFGYFEIYWVKEDVLGQHIGGAADNFDRGLHVFIGEEWARGRVQQWVSSVVHWIFSSDNRTMSVCIEPRVDNERFIQHLQVAGFNKQREVTFKHKQSWFGRLTRDGWAGPAL